LDKKDAKNFSFFQLIKAVKSVIELNGEKPFLQEQNGTEKMKITDIENAVSFFQEVLLRDEEGISKEDYLSIALQCETHICQLITFSKGFLDYRLLSIREIHLKKMRFAAPHFSHIQAILNFENETEHHFIEYPVDDDFSSNKAHFVEDSSIVLAKSQKDFSIYLNLTPFLIDKSNIEDKSNSDIFYFAYEEKYILAFKSIQEIDEKSFDISKKDDIENINVLEQDDAETAARDKSKEIVNLIATFKADIINAFSKPNSNKNN